MFHFPAVSRLIPRRALPAFGKLALLACFAPVIHAGSLPQLDASFGTAGMQLMPAGKRAGIVSAVIQQPDGKLVTAGLSYEWGSWKTVLQVERRLANGQADAGFGSKGAVLRSVSGSLDERLYLLQQPDGKLVTGASQWQAYKQNAETRSRISTLLYRLNSKGGADISFNATGSRKIGGMLDLQGMALQPDNKLTLLQRQWVNTPYPQPANSQIMNLTSKGSADKTFGEQGVMVLKDADANPMQGYGLFPQPDGKLLLATDAGWQRYTAAGVLDGSFGTNGTAPNFYGYPVPLQDGSSLALRSSYQSGKLSISRLRSDGTRDGDFGTQGQKTLDLPPVPVGLNEFSLLSAQQRADGKIWLLGCYSEYSCRVGSGGTQFFVLRIQPDGRLDTSFADNGAMLLDSAFFAKSLLQQTDGKLVLVGAWGAGDAMRPALLRYITDADTDGDGIYDGADWFPQDPAKSAKPAVLDDPDFDGVMNATDNCPLDYNPAQTDTDSDGKGNVCDSDDDNDGILDAEDVFPLDVSESVDTDGDGIGDNADADDDNDGVSDVSDAFTLDAGESSDSDGDGIGDNSDNCPKLANPDQADRDADHVGDLCDQDYDNDSVPDAQDSLPQIPYIDGSFGGQGVVVTNIAQGTDVAKAVAQQMDGKLLAVGTSDNQFSLVRYNADGALDTTFAGGKIVTAVGLASSEANGVAVQPDGKIVVAGCAVFSTGGWGSAKDFALVRYNTDGSLDAGFGVSGVVQAGLNGVGPTACATSLIIQADGKLLAAGYRYDKEQRMAMARFNGDGSLDASFGDGGKVIAPALYSSAKAVIQQADGKLVLAGNISGAGFSLWRYNANGQPDNTFGAQGVVNFSPGSGMAYAVIQQSDGKLVVAGGDYQFTVVRFNPDGVLDAGFGSAGVVFTSPGGNANGSARALVQQANGKLLVAGLHHSYDYPYLNTFALIRYLPNGTVDALFGKQGVLVTALDNGDDTVYTALQQQDGRLVLAGSAGSDFGLVRYQIDPDSDGDGVDDGGDWFPADNARWQRPALLDHDFDGIDDAADVCAYDYNPAQLDTDGDGTPDACDDDDDNDGVLDVVDAFPLDATESVDSDGDGVGDNADSDDDNDGVPDAQDPSPTLAYIDGSFGQHGHVISRIAGYQYWDDQYVRSMLQLQDGRIVAAIAGTLFPHAFTLVCYLPDGSPDVSFGINGVVETVLSGETNSHSVIQQADGKIVAAGYSAKSGWDFTLVRYNPDGTLDATFGDAGVAIASVTPNDDFAYSVIQQADGKLVVAGKALVSGRDAFALVRYNVDGKLDAGFGVDGVVTTKLSAGDDRAYAVIQQADGKLLVGGGISAGVLALVRYNADGSLDTSFAEAGKWITQKTGKVSALLKLSTGKLLVLGGSSDLLLMRLQQDGALDRSFGVDGYSQSAYSVIKGYANSLIQQADGKLLVAVGYRASNSASVDFAVVRYLPDGTLDTGFANKGILVSALDAVKSDKAYALALQADGKLVVGGVSGNSYAIARYVLDPDLDGDGVYDGADWYPGDTQKWQEPVLWPDMDFDGVVNASDNCWQDSNPSQLDTDGDGLGDACDSDKDGDGIADAEDVFPLDATESRDFDRDGVGDNADPDDDNDGVIDTLDALPFDDTGSEDADGDQIADNVDPDPSAPLNLRMAIGDGKRDKAGFAVAGAGDLDGDGYADIVVGMPNADVKQGNVLLRAAGSVVVYSGRSGKVLWTMEGRSAGAHAGYSVAAGRDVNGDGVPDIVYGAPGQKIVDGLTGVAYVCEVSASGKYCSNTWDVYPATGGADYPKVQQFGAAVALLPDGDGDKRSEIFVGAPDSSPQPDMVSGMAWVFRGGWNPQQHVAFTLSSQDINSSFGSVVAAVGDVDADGVADFAVGAPMTTVNGVARAGKFVVYSGKTGTELFSKSGTGKDNMLGAAIIGLSDVDGDGYADIAVGEPGAFVGGLGRSGVVRTYSGAAEHGALFPALAGKKAGERFGASLSALQDFHHDETMDFAVGAPFAAAFPQAGSDMRRVGRVDIYSVKGALRTSVAGKAKGAHFGSSIALAGDVNADGWQDLLIGAPDMRRSAGHRHPGAAMVYSGKVLVAP